MWYNVDVIRKSWWHIHTMMRMEQVYKWDYKGWGFFKHK